MVYLTYISYSLGQLSVIDAVTGRHHHAVDDTSSEFTRFKFKVAFLSVVILHEDPTSVPQDSSEPAATSVDRLREMADKYFDSIRRDISIVGVSTPCLLYTSPSPRD